MLVDKRDIATGSTAASTSLLQYEIDTELQRAHSRGSVRPRRAAYQVGLEAIDQIEDMVRILGDDCGLSKASLYLASEESPVEKLPGPSTNVGALRLRCGTPRCQRRRRGCSPSRPLGRSFLPAMPRSTSFASLTPCLGAAYATASRLRPHGRVCDRAGQGRVTLKTDRGHTVKARRVVFATGYESQQYLKYDFGAAAQYVCRDQRADRPFSAMAGPVFNLGDHTPLFLCLDDALTTE